MTKDFGEELDKLSDAMLRPGECDQCGEKPGSFTEMVEHLKTAHPEGGDPRHGS